MNRPKVWETQAEGGKKLHQDVAQLFDLSGQVALVTGGASKLGLDAAEILAAAGCASP